jgi:threonine/homoserine/homoserine lactone efflux protein
MTDVQNLWLYFILVAGIIALPGMDMAYVMASSLSGGRRRGFAAVAGIVAGGICHMLIAVTGLQLMLLALPALLAVMLLCGAGYLAFLGVQLLRVSRLDLPTAAGQQQGGEQIFAGALATCLLNPKAYLFMLAVFPQFVHAGHGPLWAQAGSLAAITALTQLAIYGTVAAIAARTQQALSTNPRANAIAARLVGVLFLLAAGLTLYRGWSAGWSLF